MEKLNNMNNGFTNLHNYSSLAPHWITGSSTAAQNGWTGKDVDVMAIDQPMDPTHYEFTNTETTDTRVQLVDWNYLAKHIDRLVLLGPAGWDEWRARDFTFIQMHNYITHLIESQNFPDTDYGRLQYASYVGGQIYEDIKYGNPTPDGVDVTGSMDYIDPITGDTVGFSSSMCAYVPGGYHHGTHTAGTVAGRTIGWAHEANVYHQSAKWYSGFRWNEASDEELVYYLQILKKAAGIDNPLIINNSYGYARAQGPALMNELARATTSSYDIIPQPDKDGESGYTWQSINPVENAAEIDALVNDPWELTYTPSNNFEHYTGNYTYSDLYTVGSAQTASTDASKSISTNESASVIVPGWMHNTYYTPGNTIGTILYRFIASDPNNMPADSIVDSGEVYAPDTHSYYFADVDSFSLGGTDSTSIGNLKAVFDSNVPGLELQYDRNRIWIRAELNTAASQLNSWISMHTASAYVQNNQVHTIESFQVKLPVIGQSFNRWSVYTGSLSQEGNPDLRSQLQTTQNFLGRYKWNRSLNRFGYKGIRTPGEPQAPYNNGAFNRHWYISNLANKRLAKTLFREQSMEEGAIWCYSTGNGHSVMNSLSASRATAAFECSGSHDNISFLFTDPDHGFAYPTESGTAPFIDPGAGETNYEDVYFSPSGVPNAEALRYSTNYWQDPGIYAHTRSWDEYKDGELIQENVHTMGWMPMGDLPTAMLYDENVIAVGATDCTFLKDTAMYFDERGERGFDWDNTGVKAYADSIGASDYPDDTLHAKGIHAEVAMEYVREVLGWNTHTINTWQEPFGTNGYRPRQNGEVFSPRTSSFFPGNYANQAYWTDFQHEAWLNVGGSMKVTSHNRATRTLQASDKMSIDQKANFSNTGPRTDIMAPGVDIVSSLPYTFMSAASIDHMYDMSKRDFPKTRFSAADLYAGEIPTLLSTYSPQSTNAIGGYLMKETSTAQGRSGRIYSKYGSRSGTSMACPQVVGILALYAQKKRDLTQIGAKKWLQTHAYRDYIPDPTNCTPYTTQSSYHESIYGDPTMADAKRVYGNEFLDHVALRKLSERVDPDMYAYLNPDSSEQVYIEDVDNLHYFRSTLLDQHEYANMRALHGAPNLIAHFPYYNTPIDDVTLPTTRSNNMLSNVSLEGSVGVTNIERSYGNVVFDPEVVRAMLSSSSRLIPISNSRV